MLCVSRDCEIIDDMFPIFPENSPGSYPIPEFGVALGCPMDTYFDNAITGTYLGTAFRKDDLLYGLVDTYTEEAVTFSKVSGISDSDIDKVIIVKKGAEYFKRNFTGPLNIKWFGAVNNGTTVNTNSIVRAIATCITLGGTYIYFPEGVYKTLKFTVPTGVKLIGTGTCDLPYFTGGDITKNIKGSVILVDGANGDICVELPANSHNNGIEKMSIYNNTTANIEAVIKISDGNLYARFETVEVGCTKKCSGDGWKIEGNTLYGIYINCTSNVTGIGQSYEASVRRGLHLHATGFNSRPNANQFIGGDFRGTYKLIHLNSDVQNAKFQGNSFVGTCLEGTFTTDMEIEFVANSTGIGELTHIDRYVVKYISIDNVYGLSLTGCYGELSDRPDTYNDGTHGTHPLVPVFEIGTTVINLSIVGHGFAAHLYDKSFTGYTPNKISLGDQNSTSSIRTTPDGASSMLIFGTGGIEGFAVRENKVLITQNSLETLIQTGDSLQVKGTIYVDGLYKSKTVGGKQGANNILVWDESDYVFKVAQSINGLTSINDIIILKTGGSTLKLQNENNEVLIKSVPVGSGTDMVITVEGVIILRSNSTGSIFYNVVKGIAGVDNNDFVIKSQLDNKKAATSADVATVITTADASDAGTTQSLVNELKAMVNILTTELHDLKTKMRAGASPLLA